VVTEHTHTHTPTPTNGLKMAWYVSYLTQCIQNVAFDESSVSNWLVLESALGMWRERHDGGSVDCDSLDDQLEFILENHAQLLRSIFHISKMEPTEHTRGSIMAAIAVFYRLVAAIERAAIVARMCGESVYPTSPCSTPTSPVFGSRGSAVSPVVPKCK